MRNSDNFSNKDIEALKDIFQNCIKNVCISLSKLFDVPNTTYNSVNVTSLKANEFNITSSNLNVRAGFTTGINGYGIFSINDEFANKIATVMTKASSELSLSNEVISNSASDIMQNIITCAKTYLSAIIGEDIKASIPEVISSDDNDILKELFNGAYSSDTSIVEISCVINVIDVSFKLMFVFAKSTALSISRNLYDSKNSYKTELSLENNSLSENGFSSEEMEEYSKILSLLYNELYSKINVEQVVVQELIYLKSANDIDSDILKNACSLVSITSNNKLANAFIFRKDMFYEYFKNSYLYTSDESVWNASMQINKVLINILQKHINDASIVFTKFESYDCDEKVTVPDEEPYILVKFIGSCSEFYQLISFKLLVKLRENLNKEYAKSLNKYDIEKYMNIERAILKEIPFEVSAILGEKILTIKDLLFLDIGYVIHFDKRVVDNIDIYINDIKKGEAEIGELSYNKANNYAIKVKKLN